MAKFGKSFGSVEWTRLDFSLGGIAKLIFAIMLVIGAIMVAKWAVGKVSASMKSVSAGVGKATAEAKPSQEREVI